MSTGVTSAPLISVIFPRCFMSGNLAVVTLMGYGSISLAHTGVIPHIVAASGAVPEPSNRLPSVSVFMSIPSCQRHAPASFKILRAFLSGLNVLRARFMVSLR